MNTAITTECTVLIAGISDNLFQKYHSARGGNVLAAGSLVASAVLVAFTIWFVWYCLAPSRNAAGLFIAFCGSLSVLVPSIGEERGWFPPKLFTLIFSIGCLLMGVSLFTGTFLIATSKGASAGRGVLLGLFAPLGTLIAVVSPDKTAGNESTQRRKRPKKQKANSRRTGDGRRRRPVSANSSDHEAE